MKNCEVMVLPSLVVAELGKRRLEGPPPSLSMLRGAVEGFWIL
jgi:hypothetical protein